MNKLPAAAHETAMANAAYDRTGFLNAPALLPENCILLRQGELYEDEYEDATRGRT